MKKIVRLTESDLVRIVTRVVNEQSSQKDYDSAFDVVFNKYGKDNICNVKMGDKTFPYDEAVKKFQIEINKKYNSKKVKEDGLFGPKTRAYICYKGN